MTAPDRPTSPPLENSTPTASGMSAEAWIIKGLNDLREDMKGVRDGISGVDKRLVALDRTVMKLLYGFGGAIALIAVLWTVFQFVSRFVEIDIKPKSTAHEQT